MLKNTNIIFLNKSGRLTEFNEIIQSSLNEGLERISSVLPVEDVDIVIEDSPDYAIPETGVGGQAPTAYIVKISIDPLKSKLIENLDKEIKSTLAHELHHCARMKVVGYGETLWEALVTEGLTAHFDIQINGGAPKPWDSALSLEKMEQLLNKAKEEFNSENYNHSDWFFGRVERGIPRWAGYSLAYYVVGKYLKEHPETTPAKLYSISAKELR